MREKEGGRIVKESEGGEREDKGSRHCAECPIICLLFSSPSFLSPPGLQS